MPIFIEPEDNNDIINDPDSFSGITSPGSNANYVGQTMGPGGMGISAYMDRPETQPGWTGYDYSPGYDTNTYNLGQTYGPVGMGMSAYMDRPGPMEMAAPPDNIGYDRMGPDLVPGVPNRLFREYMKRGLRAKQGLPAIQYQAGLKDWMKDKAWPWMKETGEGMKNQIPYLLDNLIPGYEPPEGYYDPDWEENKDMAGLEENDIYHLMRNGYTLEEAQEILNEQIGDGSFEMAELGLPATMDWQTDPYEKLTLDELINLGASEDQIAEYLGLV